MLEYISIFQGKPWDAITVLIIEIYSIIQGLVVLTRP